MTQEHNFSLHLFRSLLTSLRNVLWVSVYRCCTFFFQIYPYAFNISDAIVSGAFTSLFKCLLNKSRVNIDPCFIPDFTGKPSLSLERMMYLQVLHKYPLRRFPSMPSWLRVFFNQEWILDFGKFSSASIEKISYIMYFSSSINIANYVVFNNNLAFLG